MSERQQNHYYQIEIVVLLTGDVGGKRFDDFPVPDHRDRGWAAEGQRPTGPG